MVEGLLGQSGLTQAIRARVTAAAEGNPLFVEQLVSMLVDEGAIGGAASAAIAEIRIPPTIEALVAARLDRLGHDERAVIEPASVIGLVFPEPAIRHLDPGAGPRRRCPRTSPRSTASSSSTRPSRPSRARRASASITS